MKLVITLILALVALTPFENQIDHPPLSGWLAALNQNSSPIIKTVETPNTPVKNVGAQLPVLGARSVLALDLATALPLFEHQSQQKLPIASITKLATAMVILEDHELNETITVPALPLYPAEYVQLGLKPGQQFKLDSLLKAILIHSANDAADALAIYDSGSIAAFSKKMNDLVAKWGISEAHFASASGISDHDNYASARGLANLAKIGLTNPVITGIVKIKQTVISDLDGRTYQLTTTNQLLGSLGVRGVKTGYTPAAGQSFLALAEIKGHQVAVVVLNSPDRFGETSQLIQWLEQNYQWL